MTFSKAVSTVVIAAVTLLTANFSSAQQVYSGSWESSSSWSENWSSGPAGTHYNRNDQSQFKSNETAVVGGRTINQVEEHSAQSGISRGVDRYGVYNAQYAQQNGKSVRTDQARVFDGYGGHVVQTNQAVQSYDVNQGFNQTLGWDGTYMQSGYDTRSANQRQVNDIRGRTAFGDQFGQQVVQEIGGTQSQSFNQGFDLYGNRVFDQRAQNGALNQKQTIIRW